MKIETRLCINLTLGDDPKSLMKASRALRNIADAIQTKASDLAVDIVAKRLSSKKKVKAGTRR